MISPLVELCLFYIISTKFNGLAILGFSLEKYSTKLFISLHLWVKISTSTTQKETKMKQIENAVQPMKQLSIDNAVAYAQKRIDFVLEKIKESNWDRTEVAPYPNSNMNRAEYIKKQNFHYFVQKITEAKEGAEVSYKRNAPYYVQPSKDGIARFLKEVAEDAGASFDAYVYKLNEKVGKVLDAKVTTPWSLWMDSNLEVTKDDGSKQIWNTKCITNYSKYNKAFNQFPTRLSK
jgi:hypothetical protein